jgi:hypothetical protein
MAADAPPNAADNSGGLTVSGGRSTCDLRDMADKLRGRVDVLGKTFGALAITGATAVGLVDPATAKA